MKQLIVTLIALLAPACIYDGPSGVVVIHGPESARDAIETAAETWASHGAAVEVGQIGPCSPGTRCRLDAPGEHWRVVIVQDGHDAGGRLLCTWNADETWRSIAATSYAERKIYVGECARAKLDVVVTHEIGHVLHVGHDPDPDGVMYAGATTVTPSSGTLDYACRTRGWGCD